MPTKLDQSTTASRKALALFGLLLFSRRAHSLKQLAEQLCCSRQTILRLMEEITQTNICCIKKWQEGGQSWYQAESPQARPNVTLSQEELTQLLLCRDFVRHMLPEGHQHYLHNATAKATYFTEKNAIIPDLQTPLGQGAVKGSIDFSPFEKVLEILTQARSSLQVVELEYLARLRTEPKQHAFVPMRFVSYHDGLYVRGWRVTDKGTPEILSPMMLAVQRIRDIWPTRRILPKDVVISQPFPPESEHFGVAAQASPFTVQVRFFPPSTVYIQERQWSAGQSIEALPDGSVILTFTAQSELEVVKWVLSFGQEAELLAPEHLRSRAALELSVASNRYT